MTAMVAPTSPVAPVRTSLRVDHPIKIADLAPRTSTGTLSRLVLKWKIHCDLRPGPGRAVDADRAA
jgi:hypothetical protein